MRKSNQGYSLIEVLIAMAIMGSVFLSIVSLFYLGRRTVYSGKQMTQAIAVGTHALEDLSHLTMASVYDSFVVNTTTTKATYTTLPGGPYTNVIGRSTDPAIAPKIEKDPAPADAAIHGFLTTWDNEIKNNNKLQDPSVTVIMNPLDPANPIVDAQGQPDATVLQVRIIVQWRESTRPRFAFFDTTKLRRE